MARARLELLVRHAAVLSVDSVGQLKPPVRAGLAFHGDIAPWLQLFNQPDRKRIAPQFAFARADRSDDDKNDVQDMQNAEKDEADQH